MEPIIIKGNLICRESILPNTLLVIRDGIIESIQNNNFIGATIIDFGNSYIIPGLIDIHCDVIEKDVEIRPDVYVPDKQAVHYADIRYASAGITTMYHGISFGHHQRGLRDDDKAERLVRTIYESKKYTCIDS
jgi:alpha-D-ribose 1-methylphosphonate 5-triphosphate diphosphatase